MTPPSEDRRQAQRRKDEVMGDQELWRTLGELEAAGKERSKQTERIFELIGEVKDALAGIHSTLSAHIATEDERLKRSEEAAAKIEKLESWKDRGLVVIGAVAASAGAGGAGISHWLHGLLGGH